MSERTRVTTGAPNRTPAPEPTAEDLDRIIAELRASWTSRLTVRRQSRDDIGIRDIHVLVDDERIAVLMAGQEVTREIAPGPHRLKVHNTLFRKTCAFTVTVGEHASFMAINRAGFGTYSVLAFLLGGMPIYLSVEREASAE